MGAAGTDPYRMVPALMEGALERITAARSKMERRQLGQANRLLGAAVSIVNELRQGLDPRAPLDVNQYELYGYLTRQLTNANLHTRVEFLDEVSHLLQEMRVAWFLLPPRPRAQRAPAAVIR